MNIGIRLHDTRPGTLRERLHYAKEQGFSCAHIALSKALDDFSMADAPHLLTDEKAQSILSDLKAENMDCAVLGCYLNLADPDEDSRKRTQEIYRAHLRFAPRIHAGVVGTESPANPLSRFERPCYESEEAFRLFMDSLRVVVRYAEEADALLAVEPVWSHIVSTPERAQRMLDEIRSDHLMIILDAINLISPMDARDPYPLLEEAMRRLGDRVRVLHMKDYTIRDGKVLSGACGTGVMRYETLLRFAREHDLPMTLEDTNPDNAEQARKTLEQIAAML